MIAPSRCRGTPSDDLPHLPPNAESETWPVLKAVTAASRALSELNRRTDTLSDPAVLINPIALHEVKTSSEIENLFPAFNEPYRGLHNQSRHRDR